VTTNGTPPASTKAPAFQFYAGDWLRDPGVRSCSLAARGLWIDMLALMHQADRRGYLEHAPGRPITSDQLARVVGVTAEEVDRLLAELEGCNVFSRDGAAVFSRRMVRDERKRLLCQEAGYRGGNPTLKGRAKGGVKGGVKGGAKGQATPRDKRKPTPSSSSSFFSTPSGVEKGASASSASADGFDRFWAAYPRKVQKKAALKAWQKLAPGAEMVKAILVTLEAQKRCGQWQDRKFIPYPASWLNGERWEDELPEAAEGEQSLEYILNHPRIPTAEEREQIAAWNREGETEADSNGELPS
jgi:hypothetical protein